MVSVPKNPKHEILQNKNHSKKSLKTFFLNNGIYRFFASRNPFDPIVITNQTRPKVENPVSSTVFTLLATGCFEKILNS